MMTDIFVKTKNQNFMVYGVENYWDGENTKHFMDDKNRDLLTVSNSALEFYFRCDSTTFLELSPEQKKDLIEIVGDDL